MKQGFITLCLALWSVCAVAEVNRITFMPQWLPQSQFAGYYIAQEKGYYAEEGLDVTFKHVGVNSSRSILEEIEDGNADIGGMQLLQSLIARGNGARICNVMQLTEITGLCCVTRKENARLEDLDGLKVSRWISGFSEFCEIMSRLSGVNINWIPVINGINIFVYGAVDAALCYSYSELIRMEQAMGPIPEDRIIRFSKNSNLPEDGLYVTEEYYVRHKGDIAAFVRASKKGWEYCRTHIDEAVEISMQYVRENNIVTNPVLQRRMLEEYLRLQVNPETGVPDYAPVSRESFATLNQTLKNCGLIENAVKYDNFIKR